MNSDNRWDKLPKWARERIEFLEKSLRDSTAPLRRERDHYHSRLTRAEEKLSAVKDLLEKAALGGHVSAKTVIDTLMEYGIDNNAVIDELKIALKNLVAKAELSGPCDHKRAHCEEIGCIGHEISIAKKLLDSL